MNIKQNVVCIKTATQMGTGIIYPCNNKNDFEKTNYIIFTNYHLVKDLPKSGKELLLSVDIIIYDSDGKIIDIPKNSDETKVDIQLFYIEQDSQSYGRIEDIAAFFISFSYKISLDLESKIVWDDSELNEIYTEGFPQILVDNEISSKLQVRGIYKSIFPPSNRVGIFQITDDYHWYSNYKDLRLFQGFSGGPIYKNEKGSNYIAGMNQSSLNIGDGENPFKLLYYYKIKYILEFLREKGCIFFKRNEDDSVSIRWNGTSKENIKEGKGINLLLLGASGAGKSSFAKTFLLNSKYIDSTNDGQTTRTNIVYELTKTKLQPEVEIRFMNQDDFVKKMIQLNYANYILKIIMLMYKEEQINSLEDFLQYIFFNNNENMKIPDYIKDEIEKILMPQKSFDFHYNYNFNGRVSDLCEKIIEPYIEDKMDSLEENTKEILDTLSKVEGFFYEDEFRFLFDKNNDIDDNQKEFWEQGKNLYERFKNYYESFHKKIVEKLLQKDIIKKNDYTKKITFNNMEKATLELLTLCLQVKEKKSLTAMVEFVYIFDSISNEYSFIMDDLDISSLRLIDTYGLDHDNWGDSKSMVLSNIVYELIEKRLIFFDSNLAVLYIKKLDSGKPTELKSILPKIYNIIPQAPIYCVFNGLDIFLDSRVNQFKTCETFFSSVQMPRAVEYINSDKCKNDIRGSKRILDEFGENLYTTLKNNIISYCSNYEKTELYYSLYKNNIDQIHKLLVSICMKEYSSMNIIPKEIIHDIANGKYDTKFEKVIEEIFDKASKRNWGWNHWKTCSANYCRIGQQRALGYWGSYQHQWNQLFHKGYVETINNSDILREIGKEWNCSVAINACIKNMENEFLGPAYQLVNFKVGEKVEFRKIIEKMYMKGFENKRYKYNPFAEMNTSLKKDKEYLNDVCDFKKGLEFVKYEVLEHFKSCLIGTIKIENKAKSENLLKINHSFYEQYLNLKYEFEKKYNYVKFEDIMQAFFVNESSMNNSEI